MKIKAVPISSIDFSPYGKYYNMKSESSNVVRSKGDGWEDCMTDSPLINSQGSLGLTVGSPLPSKTTKMERHLHSEEALFCMSNPIVLAIANSGNKEQPMAEDIKAIIISPGEVIVLDKGIWHDACHGIDMSVPYYWFATVVDTPTEWVAISGGPVELYV
ncbi:ureidoglycolate lyase [Sporosarcina sp. YIM B06819]|uniref:ureidoglycolate lyase n=1 Tax=Sporosarcina sp. YIM B06819 TaxID=3081769 RepID=UPI00298CEF1E|nr:ureidoglycolate lyase [Sporosarcina sp. YIM B06819]